MQPDRCTLSRYYDSYICADFTGFRGFEPSDRQRSASHSPYCPPVSLSPSIEYLHICSWPVSVLIILFKVGTTARPRIYQTDLISDFKFDSRPPLTGYIRSVDLIRFGIPRRKLDINLDCVLFCRCNHWLIRQVTSKSTQTINI